MKHNVRISTVSVLYVLCMCAAGSAYGASSVRSLGGAGTYSGTASASSASGTSSSVGAARAGSVRITPTSAKATTATSTSISSGNSSAARGAATSRLSVGKYLNKVITTNNNKLGANVSSSSSSNTNISNDVMKIVEQLEGIEKRVDGLQDDVANVKILGAGEFIEINENNEISVKVDDLREELANTMDVDVGEIRIDICKADNGEDAICYCHSIDGKCEFDTLIELSALRGEKGDPGDAAKPEDLVDVLRNLDEDIAVQIAAKFGKFIKLGTDQIEDAAVTELKLSKDVQDKLNKAAPEVDLSDYATKDELATKADADDVYKKSETYDRETIDEMVNAPIADGSVTGEKLSEEVQNKLNNAIADIGLLGTELEKKQDALKDDQMAVLNSGITEEGVAQIGTNATNIETNTNAITTNTAAITENAAGIVANTTAIATNAKNITENTAAIAQKANAADVYTTVEIDEKLEGITKGSVADVPDTENDYAWVSLGGKRQWVSIAGGAVREDNE